MSQALPAEAPRSPPLTAAAEGLSRLEQMMAHNETFTRSDFKVLPTAPRKVVIVTCMDPRLNTLLPKALGLKEGEAYVVKNAGAVITHPFGGITRSVFVAIYELGAKEVYVIGHRCGGPLIPALLPCPATQRARAHPPLPALTPPAAPRHPHPLHPFPPPGTAA